MHGQHEEINLQEEQQKQKAFSKGKNHFSS